uniref:Uncharacterized protein n=1 Tax=Setaria italica TaxID=4555 RepID=K3XUD3_SETIT
MVCFLLQFLLLIIHHTFNQIIVHAYVHVYNFLS